METKQCAYCGERKEIKKFCKGFRGTTRNVCRACKAEYDYIRLKSDVFRAYGSKCACCGESNPLFLSLDHVNNDGGQYRKQTGHDSGQTYRLVRRLGYPPTYQLLCTSCNSAKGHYGVCPHKSGRTADVVWAEWEKILDRKGKKFRNYQERLTDENYKEKRPWKRGEMLRNKYAAHLTSEQVMGIMTFKSLRTQKDVARQFGVSRALIGLIWQGKRWLS